jgi:[ribosomal protein S18]-alanine N-acetyltransferase
MLRRYLAPYARLTPLPPAQFDAAAAIHATGFSRGWSEEEIDALTAQPGTAALGAEWAGGLLGFVVVRAAADEAEILTIAVDPAWRGCGLAGRLLDGAIEEAAMRGGRKLFLEVDAGNVPALALYRRRGFAEVGRRFGYYAAEGGGDALVLARDLGPPRAPRPD